MLWGLGIRGFSVQGWGCLGFRAPGCSGFMLEG